MKEEGARPLMCACALAFRPTVLAMTLLNDCKRCDGTGWVREHEYTGDEEACTVCGQRFMAHWEKEANDGD